MCLLASPRPGSVDLHVAPGACGGCSRDLAAPATGKHAGATGAACGLPATVALINFIALHCNSLDK